MAYSRDSEVSRTLTYDVMQGGRLVACQEWVVEAHHNKPIVEGLRQSEREGAGFKKDKRLFGRASKRMGRSQAGRAAKSVGRRKGKSRCTMEVRLFTASTVQMHRTMGVLRIVP